MFPLFPTIYWQYFYKIRHCSHIYMFKKIFFPPRHEWTVLIHILSLILLGSSDAARSPARQLVLGCLLACCLRCWRPHWNASWVSGRETTSLINPESPHSLFTVSPSNRSEPRATTRCHQCRHWLSGLISVCLACQINAFLTACRPCRRPQMNISYHLWSNHNSKHNTLLTLLLLWEILLSVMFSSLQW